MSGTVLCFLSRAAGGTTSMMDNSKFTIKVRVQYQGGQNKHFVLASLILHNMHFAHELGVVHHGTCSPIRFCALVCYTWVAGIFFGSQYPALGLNPSRSVNNTKPTTVGLVLDTERLGYKPSAGYCFKKKTSSHPWCYTVPCVDNMWFVFIFYDVYVCIVGCDIFYLRDIFFPFPPLLNAFQT